MPLPLGAPPENSFPATSRAAGRVADRGPGPMSDRDHDIEFDFFEDEPETGETVADPSVLPRRGAERRRRRAAAARRRGFTPLLRLSALVAVAIFVVVLLVFGVDQLPGRRASDSRTRATWTTCGRSRTQSTALGKPSSRTIARRRRAQARRDLETQSSRGLARQEQQHVDAGAGHRPPGPLRDEHQHLVEALAAPRERARRPRGRVPRRPRATKDAPARSARRSPRRPTGFVASDVVWDDLFRAPANAVSSQQEGVTRVTVPDSNFVANPDLASSRRWRSMLQRIRGASAGRRRAACTARHSRPTKALPSGTDALDVHADDGDRRGYRPRASRSP